MQQVGAPPPPLSSLRPDVSRSMLAVVERAMQKRPADRFATAGAPMPQLSALRS